MGLPTSYTESELANYMHSVVGNVATVLGWSAPASYTEAVNDVCTLLGITEIESVSDIPLARSAARVAVWRQASEHLVTAYDFTDAANQQFVRNQMYKATLKHYKNAQLDFSKRGGNLNALGASSVLENVGAY